MNTFFVFGTFIFIDVFAYYECFNSYILIVVFVYELFSGSNNFKYWKPTIVVLYQVCFKHWKNFYIYFFGCSWFTYVNLEFHTNLYLCLISYKCLALSILLNAKMLLFTVIHFQLCTYVLHIILIKKVYIKNYCNITTLRRTITID